MNATEIEQPPALSQSAPRWQFGARTPALDGLHLFVLSAFAIAQPIYDRLGDRSAFLVDKGIRSPAVLILVACVSLLVPAALVLLERLAARFLGRWASESLHAIFLLVLITLIALPVWKIGEVFPGAGALTLALLSSAAGVFCYFRKSIVRTVMTMASPGIVIFPLVLIFFSSVTGRIFPPARVHVNRFDPAPVIMLVFDEFCGSTLMRPDRTIDAERFPNFAALARDATWFRNAAAVHPDTSQALPAILSGKYPSTGWIPTPADLPQNLFSVLESTGGYELAAFEPVSSMAPHEKEALEFHSTTTWAQFKTLSDTLGRVYLFHLSPHEYYPQLPSIPSLWFNLRNTTRVDPAMRRGVFRYSWGERREDQFNHFLATLDDSGTPLLAFMHILLPHVPWCYLPSSRRYSEDGDAWDLLNFNTHSEVIDYWGLDELIIVQSQLRYLLQLEYADRQIGRLIARLKESGLYDRSLLIVTADHGVSFRTGEARRMISPGNLSDIQSIPMFVKRPGQTKGGISDRHSETVDLLPTITDVLGIDLADPVDGWSLFDESRPDRKEHTFLVSFERRKTDPSIIVDSDVPKLLHERFGDASDRARMFRIGPYPELVGRRLEDCTVDAEPGPPLAMIRYGDSVDDDPQKLIPCFFEGTLQLPAKPEKPVVLAVTVNGVIQATTRTYDLKDLRDRFAALVPEAAFHPGQNDVQFHLVTGAGDALRLALCPLRIQPAE